MARVKKNRAIKRIKNPTVRVLLPMASPAAQTDYRKVMWDRLDDIAYPGEHANLFGHDDALDILCRAYKSQKIHHAWMVTGPKGIGKATFALAIAAHIIRNPVPSDAPSSFVQLGLDDSVTSALGKGGHPNLLHLSRPLDPKSKNFKRMHTSCNCCR